MTVLIRGDARALPLPDGVVDLVVTSPPFHRARDYEDARPGDIGTQDTPAGYVAALLPAVVEMVRVLAPGGSIFVNLGDRYADDRSLDLIPDRFRIAVRDDLGLIVRAVTIWSKPNPLPDGSRDRVRRSHEDWIHIARPGRVYADLDPLREPHTMRPQRRPIGRPDDATPRQRQRQSWPRAARVEPGTDGNPRGKVPGSVWTIPTQPLRVPPHVAARHYAAFPVEWPRRLIMGWCPPGGLVLDPFGGTGTVGLAADALGVRSVCVEQSATYQRVARWRTSDPAQRARASAS